MRHVVTRPLVKGEVSTQLTARLDPPYLRYCGACKATHSWEVPFRIGALYAGLELEPGTSPPVLRRIPGWPRRAPGPAPDPMAAPAVAATDPELPEVPRPGYTERCRRVPRLAGRRDQGALARGRASKSASMAGPAGFWVRWATSSMIENCCACSAASISFSRARTET